MRRAWLPLLVLLAACQAEVPKSASNIKWVDTYGEGLAQAKKEGKSMLLFFTSKG